ncbi:ABC transporter permease subunit [Longimicrobium sp.]|uniref:ABC transporter permease subunit n=1 Tax=Longimicrobium sp. TaxID=2029185 RepID=UPI002F9396DE
MPEATVIEPRAPWLPPADDEPILAPPPARRRGGRVPLGTVLLFAAVIGYLALVLVGPLAALAVRALETGPGPVLRAVTSPEALSGLWHSLIIVVVTLVVNGTLGIAGAIVLVRHRFVGRRVLDLLVDLPLAVSPVMVGLAFLLVFGRGGWLHPAIDVMGFQVAFAFPGILLVTLFVTLPYTLREVAYVLDELGTAEEEVAATLGASPWQTFRRVTLPNVSHAARLGLTLTGARALGEFGAAVVVGGAISGRTQTATTFIYAALEERNPAGGFGMALLLALLSLGLLLLLRRLKTRQEHV